jgi:hypothetical protein
MSTFPFNVFALQRKRAAMQKVPSLQYNGAMDGTTDGHKFAPPLQ